MIELPFPLGYRAAKAFAERFGHDVHRPSTMDCVAAFRRYPWRAIEDEYTLSGLILTQIQPKDWHANLARLTSWTKATKKTRNRQITLGHLNRVADEIATWAGW